MQKITECCAYQFLLDGKHCKWCGKEAVAMTPYQNELWTQIDMELCDWDRPSQMASFNLHENIGKVYRLIKRLQKDD